MKTYVAVFACVLASSALLGTDAFREMRGVSQRDFVCEKERTFSFSAHAIIVTLLHKSRARIASQSEQRAQVQDKT